MNIAEGTHVTDLKAMTDHVLEEIRRGRYTLSEFQRALARKTRQAAHKTNDFAHEHPWQVLGAGVGVGIAAGILLSRTMSLSEPNRHPKVRKGEKAAPAHAIQSTLLFVLSVVKAVQAFRSIRL